VKIKNLSRSKSRVFKKLFSLRKIVAAGFIPVKTHPCKKLCNSFVALSIHFSGFRAYIRVRETFWKGIKSGIRRLCKELINRDRIYRERGRIENIFGELKSVYWLLIFVNIFQTDSDLKALLEIFVFYN
jgi:hypothetical protein